VIVESDAIDKPNALGTLLAAVVILLCAWPLAFFRMAHYLPEVDTDEAWYFLQVKTFLYHGLRGGYFFTNDSVPASPIHFDAHGPGFAVIYGLIARVIGWHNYSPYAANLLLLIPSWLLLFSVTRGRTNRIAVSVFVLLHAYFFLFLPSAMQEGFHISIGVLTVALWVLALDTKSRVVWISLAVVIIMASVVRATWALAIPAVLFSFLRQRFGTVDFWTARNAALSGLAFLFGAIATVVAVRLLAFWSVPSFWAVSASTASPVVFHLHPVATDLRSFLSLRSYGHFQNWPAYFRVSTWILLAGWAAIAVFGGRRNREVALDSLVVLALPVAAHIMFYVINGWTDFRGLAPFHAVAGLSFAARADFDAVTRRRPWSYACTAACVLLIGLNLSWAVVGVRAAYEKNWKHRTTSTDLAGAFLFKQMEEVMRVSPEDSAFCKTSYVRLESFNDPRIIHLPLGFAVSVLRQVKPGVLPSLKGKYVLVGAHYLTTRAGLEAMGINPDNHEAIIGAELTGRIPQGRASGWADDDPHNPTPDWKELLARSQDWKFEKEADDYALFRSTTNCLD
jgi:hypothetical protein